MTEQSPPAAGTGSLSLTEQVKQLAREAGFELCGFAPVREHRELAALSGWIAAQHHGEMKYMESRDEAGELKRASLARVAPWAQGVIVCAINYNTAHPYSTHSKDATRGWISRYAWSREDYHQSVICRLRVVESKLHQLINSPPYSASTAARDLQTRCYVDTGPLMERVFAKYAGVGWIGKNTCIINQKLGSWLFLGVILTSMDLASIDLARGRSADHPAPIDLPAPDRCGTCTRCIVACPTQAIVAPGQLDARRCISYLTIEKRGQIPEELRLPMGRHVFGCDICQDVCPWNCKAPPTGTLEFQPQQALINPWLDWLAEMKPDEFRSTFRESPVRRAKFSGLRRNAVIAMGNSGDQKFVPALKRLAEDDDHVVANHAKWALARLENS